MPREPIEAGANLVEGSFITDFMKTTNDGTDTTYLSLQFELVLVSNTRKKKYIIQIMLNNGSFAHYITLFSSECARA